MTCLSTRVGVLTLGAAALLACADEPLNVGSDSRSAGMAPQAASVKAEGDIQGLVDAQIAAWSAKDATAFAATFEIDAKFFGPTGHVLVGREEIRAGHAFLFGGPFAPSTEALVIADIRFLTGTIAVVHLRWLWVLGLQPAHSLVTPGCHRV